MMTLCFGATPSTLDIKNFKGEKVVLTTQPANIRAIEFKIKFPPGYKILSEEQSFFKIFSTDGKEIKAFSIKGSDNQFKFKSKLKTEIIYAQLNLNFCKDGPEAMCLIKNVLFEIPLDKSAKPAILQIEYSVPAVTN